VLTHNALHAPQYTAFTAST